jgi:alanine dehydrogenase
VPEPRRSKSPFPRKYGLFNEGQILFTFLHLAGDETLTEALLKTESVGIAYETVQKDDGYLPLLAPMSEIA